MAEEGGSTDSGGSVGPPPGADSEKPLLGGAPSPAKHSRPVYSQQPSRVSRTSSRHGAGRTSTLRSQLSQPRQSPQSGSNWGRVRNAVKRWVSLLGF